MQSSPIQFSSHDIARWSEPLIADCVYAAYESSMGGRTENSEALGRLHCRLWRNLLNGELVLARYLRRELLKAAVAEKLGDATLDAIDSAVFEQLLDVIIRRGQRAARPAHVDGMSLLRAASALGEDPQAGLTPMALSPRRWPSPRACAPAPAPPR